MADVLKKETPRVTLRTGAIGLVAVASLGAIMMSPALGIYSWFPAIMTTAGGIVPFIFILALLVSIPTAVSYAVISRTRPSAGSAYTWVAEATRPRTGTWLGIMLALYYLGVIATMPVQFALYFNEFLSYFGVHATGYGYFAIGVLLSSAVVAVLSYPEVKISARGAVTFMAFESLVVLALAITVGFKHGSSLGSGPLNPGTGTGGTTAIFGALIFGVLAFTGYDAATTVAEETKTPKRLVPIAVVSALVLTAVFWIVCSYLLSYSASTSQVTKDIAAGVTPFGPIAKTYWGHGSILVDITGMTASLGVYVAAIVGVGRVLFAMGRDRVLPHSLGRLHPRHQTPWNALHVLFGLAIAINLIGGAILGSYNFLLWVGNATVWFALITYLFVNVANVLLHRGASFNWLTNGVVPVLGVAITIYLIYKGFFVSLWDAGFKTGRSVVLLCLLLSVIAAVVVILRRDLGGRSQSPDLAADARGAGE
jgi:putrescine importer